MTIAEQVAQCFLESIEKTINENKMDVGALESNTYYRSEKIGRASCRERV